MESLEYEIAQDRKIRRVMYCQATPAAVEFVRQCSSSLCRHAARNNAAATKPLEMCDCVDVWYDM